MATGNAINANTAGVVKYDGAGTFSANTTTNHNVLLGAASNGFTNLAPSATTGIAVVSQGAAADPAFSTVVAAGGGTGLTSWTDTNALLCTGTTSTGNAQDIPSVATGQVLISQGTSTKPAFSATPTVTSITFGSGSALSSYVENGSWTPVLKFGGGTTGITYSTQTGVYTRVGNMLFYSYQITLTNKGSSTGSATLTGLPFTIGGSLNITSLIGTPNNLTLTGILFGNGIAGGTLLNIDQITTTGTVTQLTETAFANNTSIGMTGYYFI